MVPFCMALLSYCGNQSLNDDVLLLAYRRSPQVEPLSSSWQHITQSWQSRAHAQLSWTPRLRLEWTSQAAVLLSQRKQVQCMKLAGPGTSA